MPGRPGRAVRADAVNERTAVEPRRRPCRFLHPAFPHRDVPGCNRAYATEVEDHMPVGDRAVCLLVHHPVRPHAQRPLARQIWEVRIVVAGSCPLPDPAAVGVNADTGADALRQGLGPSRGRTLGAASLLAHLEPVTVTARSSAMVGGPRLPATVDSGSPTLRRHGARRERARRCRGLPDPLIVFTASPSPVVTDERLFATVAGGRRGAVRVAATVRGVRPLTRDGVTELLGITATLIEERKRIRRVLRDCRRASPRSASC